MHTSCKIDTLNLTHKEKSPDVLDDVMPHVNRRDMTLEPVTPQRGYNGAWRINPYGYRLNWHDARKEMGRHFQYGGDAINQIFRRDGRPSSKILTWHVGRGAKISRIDIAVDVFDSEWSLLDFEKREANLKTGARKEPTYVKSANNGWTVYVGSRTSDRFLRIYNKSAESETDVDHIRIELECKGRYARALALRLNDVIRNENDLFGDNIANEIKKFAHYPHWSSWCEALGSKPTETAQSGKKPSGDTRAWLLSTVSGTLAREIARDKHFLLEFRNSVKREVDNLLDSDVNSG